MSDMADTNGSGTGLTLKQLVLEVRDDIRAMRVALEQKVDVSEFNRLKDQIEGMLSGRVTTAYGAKIMQEFVDLQKSVKDLSVAKEKADAAMTAVSDYESKLALNRKWIVGLAAGLVTQGLVLAAKLIELAQKGQ